MPRRPQLAVVPFNYPTDRAYEDLRERDASRPAVWIQRSCHRLAPFWQQMNAATHPEGFWVLGSGFWVYPHHFFTSPYREGVETRKLWLKLRLKKTAENIKNVIFQPNPSQISYFKQIWGSFEKWSVFGLPLQGGGGYPKIVVEIKVKENCWKHQKRNIPTKS